MIRGLCLEKADHGAYSVAALRIWTVGSKVGALGTARLIQVRDGCGSESGGSIGNGLSRTELKRGQRDWVDGREG